MALNQTFAFSIPGLFLLIIFFLPVILGVVFLGWQRSVRIVHQESGLSGHCFFGYSWTYFLFGFFVPIFRGEILIGLLHFFLSVITFGIFQIIMPFLYNKQYSVRKLTGGWVLNDDYDKNMIAKQRFGFSK